MNEQQNLVKKESPSLAYLHEKDAGKMGTENIDNSDLMMPRIKLVQALTREKFDAKEGDIIHSVNGTNYGRTLRFVPIVHWKTHINFDRETFKIACRSLDGKVCSGDSSINEAGTLCSKCGKTAWLKDVKPECAVVYNYLIAIESDLKYALERKIPLLPLTFSLMSSSIKIAKYINTAIKSNAMRQRPIYSQFIELGVEEKKGKADAAYPIFTAKTSRFVLENEFSYLKAMFVEMSKMKIDMTKNSTELVKEESEESEEI